MKTHTTHTAKSKSKEIKNEIIFRENKTSNIKITQTHTEIKKIIRDELNNKQNKTEARVRSHHCALPRE